MKRYYCILFILSFLSISLNAQTTGTFRRLDTLSVQPLDAGGWGEVVAGLDLDKDGKPEIYAVNSNAIDEPPSQLTPRIYKYELNNNKWEIVWSAEIPDIKQNTWPALTYGDLDKDGKGEIIFAPANWVDTEHPNPDRVFVYEAREGSDSMGVDIFGSSAPNAKFKIATTDNSDIRPMKWFVEDYDGDGTPELMFCDRSSGTGALGFGILSVDKIPDNADGSEKWTIEASGLSSLTGFPAAIYYDIAWLNNVLYLWDSKGNIVSVKYNTDKTWKLVATQTTIGGATGSFKTAQVADIDNDGTKEIVFGGWSDGKAYVCKQLNDTLAATVAADYSLLGVTRLNGGGKGDLDKDGKIDFVFGSRNNTATKVFDAVVRLQYTGGKADDPKSYTPSVIDSLIHPNTGQLDIVTVGDVDKDSVDEAVYSSGYPRGTLDFPNIPLVILKYQSPSGVQKENSRIPANFFLAQNFPNPFNPSTTIRFGLPGDAVVTLRIFNILGQEVATLLNSEQMSAGSYNVDFNASKLTSGTYIYQLNYNNQTVTKKMLLMK